jgi:broad specificity phosphatase PhoE
LTNHGFQQATRLGQHLYLTGVELSHVFASHLKRAVNTAELVRDAQLSATGGNKRKRQLEVQQVPLLAEQDFGSLEGVSHVARPAGSIKSGKANHTEIRKDDPDFVASESKESMIVRTNKFLDQHLFPLLDQLPTPGNVAIVSHGILLGVLWRSILQRLPPKSISYDPELLASHGRIDLERLGGWSNTGYMELELRLTAKAQKELATLPPQSIKPLFPTASVATLAVVSTGSEKLSVIPTSVEATPSIPQEVVARVLLTSWATTIHAINSTKHLVGLKRTGGGVGSARHDSKQKSIDTFFKRQKGD